MHLKIIQMTRSYVREQAANIIVMAAVSHIFYQYNRENNVSKHLCSMWRDFVLYLQEKIQPLHLPHTWGQ